MNFDAHHYVPVLKVKLGEKKALANVSDLLRSRITPFLEIVERSPDKTIDAHLKTSFNGLAEATSLYTRCFLDVREINSDGPGAAEATFERATEEGINFTPVTGLSRIVDVAAAMLHKSNGIAIRLTLEEFEKGLIHRGLSQFVEDHKLTQDEVDLIVDLGPVDQLVLAGVSRMAAGFLAEIPDPTLWRTLTLSACAFPASMGGVERNSHRFVERNAWLVWRDELYVNRKQIPRLPTFSDCGIQHTAGVEGFDFKTMQSSAAVRYACSDAWLLIKGEGTKNNPARLQFPGLATQLVYGHLRDHYAGTGHCVGCESIKNAADGAPNLGSAGVWRRLGTIHHLTTALECLDNLTWP